MLATVGANAQTINGNVYGGGEKAKVDGDTDVIIKGGNSAVEGNVYGGNDKTGAVTGIANITINGGIVKKNVYGAGNGDYEKEDVDYSTIARPQANGVNLTLAGNSETNRAKVLGQVFGGGNSCTIAENGQLHVNLGSHVTIGSTYAQLGSESEYLNEDKDNVSGLFMGCSGKNLDENELDKVLICSDNVSLNVVAEAEDIWISNFVGGGFRGSMQANSEGGHFAYTLPAGVTIGHDVIGGAYNSKGILAANGSAETTIGKVFDSYSSDKNECKKDFSGNSDDTGLRLFKENALVRLDLRNAFEPELVDGKLRGGNVFGGCYSSGVVEGDVWTDYRCYLKTTEATKDYFTASRMLELADNFEDNFTMMLFGAGYGENTAINGDTYIRVLYDEENEHYPSLFNAFGGSYQGSVEGDANVFYNSGKEGILYGSIYGGGCKGYVKGKTFLELSGGFINDAYCGAREASVGGGTHVWSYDGKSRPWALDGSAKDGSISAPLIVARLFGGNDVSGHIGWDNKNDEHFEGAEYHGWTAEYTADNWSEELGGEDNRKKFDSYLQVGGTDISDRGYPLIGEVFAGGNGEDTDPEKGQNLPTIGTALIEVTDGSIVHAFGGGNHATVRSQNYLFVNGNKNTLHQLELDGSLPSFVKEKIIAVAEGEIKVFGNKLDFDGHHILRLFGGNNVATMDIQPKWNLKSGSVKNVYSGGNMGDMTYYNPKGETKGLCIEVNSDDINIESLYGGCRMSDVKAMVNATTPAPDFSENEYGATVNIRKGNIGNVYGGNDISGYVYNGTNVNLSGSITGNVYGAGNGNYLYAYDKKGEHVTSGIAEVWNNDVNEYVYWIPGNADATPLQQLLALNKVRPHVSKAYLDIQGSNSAAGEKVYIPGSVYCGGNASTIRPMTNDDDDAHVKFNIGNNVIVNEVFMGSNGESLKYDANGKSNYLVNFEKVNGLNLATDLTNSDWSVLNNGNVSNADKELVSMDADLRNKLYPNLLSVYMRAVDMKAMPQGFDIGKDEEGNEKTFTNTWIGTFCMGGNAGSMMVDQPMDIVFPQSLNFFGRIIGGCKDASFQYKGKWHRGGFRMPLADGATLKDDNGASQPTKTKLRMKIRGDWYSRRMVLDNEYKEYRDTYKAQDYLAPDKTDDGVNWNVNGKAWHDGCNVYGGCYQSGDMVGDVQIYIESDMLAYSDPRYGTTIDVYANKELDESNKLNLPVANVYGAGYGPESRSFGDAYIYMKDIPNVDKDTHPSVNNIFGGGRNGMLVGNTVIHVHDGLVYKDVVGGCFAAPLYGSSQVTIGYPKFYVCKKSGEYFLDRADKWNTGYQTKGNNRMDDVVKQSIKYFEGDYVPCNVYDLIKSVKLASGTTDDLASIHTGTRAGNAYFDYFDESNSYLPQGGWDNVEVRVRGGVYGGGFSLSNSTAAVAGSYTTLACTEAYNQGTDSEDNSSVGYGGNSSIIISDRGDVKNHIRISTETTKSVSNSNGKVEYTANGGVYGDGRLVFCEGFRTAELNNYGYADSDPLMLNTLQRMDLLTINDCNFKLYGDQDFATDQLDARNYSLARIGELRMNSSIPADEDLPENKRNYIAFYNNIHYLGAIVTNDDFHNGKFHDPDGKVGTETYRQNKQSYIDRYHDKTDATSVAQFKLRNYATARNMLGINSGYCLRVENQYYNGEEKAIYYGPVVGVAEVKLLNVRQGEGGGYVYADNIHADVYDPEHPETATFMNESGNFVFQGVVRQGETEKQFIIDDCLPIGFDEWKAGRAVASELPEQHYWYVIGDTYYYNTTLTAYTYNNTKTFDLTNSDPNVIFAGIENGDDVILESVKWLPADYSDGYSSDIRGGRDNALTSLEDSDAKYKFLVQVNAWSQEMPRSPSDDEAVSQDNKPHALYNASAGSPRFNVRLLDNVNNSPEGEEDGYYNSHLSVPEHVQLIVKAKHKDGTDSSGNDVYSYKTYNVTLEIIYLQGPSFTGNVKLENCALPGEYIAFSSDGIKVKTTQQLPLTGYSWKLVPQKSGSDNEWDIEKAVTIPADYYKISLNGDVEGSIPALYGQNKWNIFYTFNAGGETFTVEPKKDESADLHERMLVVHNYHKMADINDQNFNVTLSNVDGDNIFSKVLADGAKIYIADDEDLKAFGNYINAGNTGKGMDFYLQDNLTLPINWKINSTFAGTLHGDGYVLNAADNQSFLGALSETAKVYNLGVVGRGARIASAGAGVVNCFVASDDAEMKYGKTAYELSHYHNATDNPDYVHEYYSGDDWRYARTAREDIGSHGYLRTATPYYGNKNTAHNMEHNDEAYIPVEHDYLFFGQSLNPNGSKQPEHIDNDEANRVFAGKGYFNSKVDNGFYYNKSAAWAMQEGLTAVRFHADNVPASIGVVEEGITRNLLVYGADDATVAAASAAFFHIKGSEGNYSCDDLSLVDSQDFNAPFAFTATKASYERTPNFVVKRGTAWEALCLPFAPTAVKALKGDEEKAITHFHGDANTDNIDGTAGDADANANNIGHDYWLRELTGSDTDTDGGLVAKFSRPAAAEYVAYRPYIVSFPGETFYEFNLSGSTIRWEAENAAIGVTDDATTSMSADKITYNGAFRNVDNGYVLNGDGDAFVDSITNAFRGYITLASTQAKRLIRIGSDYDDLLYNEQVPNEPIIDIHGNSSEVFNIKVKGHEVYVTSSENVSYPCNTVTGASIGTWVIPAGKSRFTISASGIYIINGIKFVIK